MTVPPPAPCPTELILSATQRSLGHFFLPTQPQPGTVVFHAGCAYTVLERRHRYQFIHNHYQLHHITLYVQEARTPEEKTWMGQRWVWGDATCRYNAQSELIRCAVNPAGPCQTCLHYEPRTS
jgi:hypothetical protein